jgi:hypothetical protein
MVDSFGWSLFQQELANLSWLVQSAAVQDQITSVFPSTTVAALSSIWTGYAPAQHGLVGLRLFFPDQAVLGQMLSFSPTFSSFPGSLIKSGLEPGEFLQVPGFAEQLAAAGIPSHSLKGYQIIHSSLSQMHDRGIHKQHAIVTQADLFVQLRALLEETAGSALYVNAYWPAVDTLSHIQGPAGPSVAAELHSVLGLLKTLILDQLSDEAKEGTVLFITGDHGQVLALPNQYIPLDDHPELKRMLLMRPAGEPRTPYLYARQGQKENVLAYMADHLSHAAFAMDSAEALESGLLGPGPHSTEVSRRTGDVVVAMREGYLLLTTPELKKAGRMIGRHGGMTAEEMQVPWLGLRLDSL